MLILNTQEIGQRLLYGIGSRREISIIASPMTLDSDQVQKNGGEEIERNNRTGSTALAPGQYLQGTGFNAWELKELVKSSFSPGVERFAFVLESLESYKGPHSPLPTINLTSQDAKRWKMAWRAIQFCALGEQDYGRIRSLIHRQLIAQRCQDWPDRPDISYELPVAFGFSAAALVYGGLHALAWFAHFDSTTEQLLWRISASVVMGGVPVILVLHDAPYTGRYFLIFRSTHVVIQYLVDTFSVVLWSLPLLAYVLARAYLVVECFISLSHLPAEVYDVPTWSTYFPHIS